MGKQMHRSEYTAVSIGYVGFPFSFVQNRAKTCTDHALHGNTELYIKIVPCTCIRCFRHKIGFRLAEKRISQMVAG